LAPWPKLKKRALLGKISAYEGTKREAASQELNREREEQGGNLIRRIKSNAARTERTGSRETMPLEATL